MKFNLITNDQVTFVVNQEFVKESTLLTEFTKLHHVKSNESLIFPLPEVSSQIFPYLIRIAKLYEDAEPYVLLEPLHASNSQPPVDREDMQILIGLSTQQLHDFICASSYLDMPRLLDLGLYALNILVREKDVDEMAFTLGIKRDPAQNCEPQIREHILYCKLDKDVQQ